MQVYTESVEPLTVTCTQSQSHMQLGLRVGESTPSTPAEGCGHAKEKLRAVNTIIYSLTVAEEVRAAGCRKCCACGMLLLRLRAAVTSGDPLLPAATDWCRLFV
jgi:hypothetical protein